MIPTQEDVSAYLDYLSRSGEDVSSQDSELLAMAFLLATPGEGCCTQALIPYIDEWKFRSPAACC
jgi:hypothetical protein